VKQRCHRVRTQGTGCKTLRYRRCSRNECVGNETIFDCTGGKRIYDLIYFEIRVIDVSVRNYRHAKRNSKFRTGEIKTDSTCKIRFNPQIERI